MDRRAYALAAVLLVAGALGGLLLLSGPGAPDDPRASPLGEPSGSPAPRKETGSGREPRPEPVRPGEASGARLPRESAAPILVRVVDENREPIPGALLRAGPDLRPVRVDATGSATVESPEGTLDALIASAPGFAARTFRRIPAGSGLLAILSPVTRFTGAVRDPAGDPVEGALVKLIPVARRDMEPREQPTGERGAFAIDGLAPGRYDVAVGREGFATRHDLDLVIPSGGLVREYTLEAGRQLVLQTIEAEGKRIVSGAIVRLSWTPAAAGNTNHLREIRGPYVSDGDGLVRIPGLARGSALAVGRATGYGATLLALSIEPDAPGNPVPLYLPRPLRIEGSVVRPDGSPAIGAKVVLRVDGIGMEAWEDLAGFAFAAEPFEDGAGRQWPTVRTDSAARFRIAGLPPAGTLRLHAIDPEGRFAASPSRMFDLGKTRSEQSVAFTLAEGRRVRGSVFDAEGEPVFDAVVTGGSLRSRTAPDGTYLLGPVGAAEAKLIATHPGFAPAAVAVEPGAADAPAIVMERGACVQGVVVDDHGAPIFGAWVHARIAGTPARAGSTDAAGRFVLGGLPAAEIDLHVHAPGFRDATRENIAADGNPLVVRLSFLRPLEAGSISFQAADSETGVAIHGAEARAGGIRQIERQGARLLLRNASPGFHDLTVTAPGYAPRTRTGIAVSAGEAVDLGVLPLERFGSLAVTPAVPGRAPPRTGYRWSLARRGGGYEPARGQPQLDPRGAAPVFRFSDLPPGAYDLDVSIGSGTGRASVVVEPGREAAAAVRIEGP